MPTRRALLKGAALLAGGGLLAPRAAWAAEPFIFAITSVYDPNFFEVLNAYSGGHFTRQGLDGKVISVHGTAVGIQEVLADQVQFSDCTGVDLIRTVATTKAPLVAIATIYQESNFYLISAADQPIAQPTDLKGKRIGLISYGGAGEVFVDLALLRGGLTKDDVTLLSTGNSPGELELVKQGRLDGFVCTLAVVLFLQQAGAAIHVWKYDTLVPAPGQVYFTTRALLDKRPGLVRDFLRAIKSSVREIAAGPVLPLYQRAARDFDITGAKNPAVIEAFEKVATQQLWLAAGKENLLRNVPRRWQEACDALAQAGIAKIDDPATLYDTTIIDEVMKS